jgi:gliding motility-associated-like protein
MYHINKLTILLLATLFLSLTSYAQNHIFAQLNGTPVNTAGWNLQGAAKVANVTSTGNSEILVCPANAASGAVFYNQPINLSLCNKWKAEFDFRMFDGTGADGLAFCFLDVPPNGFVAGGGLGIPSTANGLKVCFDTWNNCIPFNPSTVHLNMPKIEIRWGAGYDECASEPTKDNSDGGISFISSNAYNHAKITYDNGNISVYVNDSLYLTGYQQFNYSGYLGFTASTGGYNDNHSIKNVIIYTEMPPSFAGAGAGVCPDNALQLGTTADATYIYSWSPSNGLNATNISNPIVQLDNISAVTQSHVYYVKTSYNNKPGCTSIDSVTVKVYPRPMVNFLLPDICLNDATAQFYDSSFTGDPSTLPFSYYWNFGDLNATPANPNSSTTMNPLHSYSAAANYNVSLEVKNNKGCSDSLSKMFTVNGAIPRAGFTVNNAQSFCSNKPLYITDKSSVNFGKIIKVEIFWGDTTGVSEIDNDPSPGKIYQHFYPLLQTTPVMNYTIQYRVYSGISCVSEVTKVVTIQQSPHIVFPPIASFCQDSLAFKLNQETETTGLPGMFSYYGNGVSADGWVYPLTVGEGTHVIMCKYIASNTCEDSAFQNITIWPVPTVDAGPDLFVLKGGSVSINANATASNVDYLWNPSLYLNNDTIINPVSSPLKDIKYTVTVTGVGGCSAMDSVHISVLLNPNIPNAFSPNNDGLNDTWQIRYLDTYPDCEVDIYNRYGQHIFHSLGYTKAWDGTFNGNPQPVGAYSYIIRTKKINKQFSGSVMIIR